MLTHRMIEEIRAVHEDVRKHALETWLDLDGGGKPPFEFVNSMLVQGAFISRLSCDQP